MNWLATFRQKSSYEGDGTSGGRSTFMKLLHSISFTFTNNNTIRMLQSMTGFGRAEQAVGDKVFLVEVKSLNGKQFDLRITIPPLLKPF